MKFKAFLRSANTHFVGLLGVSVTVLAQVVGFVSLPQVSGVITAVLPAADRPYFGYGLTFVGCAMAYFGRPKSIPPSDAQQVAAAEAVGAPHPITPAAPEGK